MRSAKCKTVIQQHAPISDIDSLYVDRESLPKTLPQRQIKRRMTRQMVAGILRRRRAVRESRSVIHVGRRIGMPRQVVLSAEMQRVALVVIQQSKPVAERKV